MKRFQRMPRVFVHSVKLNTNDIHTNTCVCHLQNVVQVCIKWISVIKDMLDVTKYFYCDRFQH